MLIFNGDKPKSVEPMEVILSWYEAVGGREIMGEFELFEEWLRTFVDEENIPYISNLYTTYSSRRSFVVSAKKFIKENNK